MNAKTLDLLCIAVLCTILTLGLWPFHSPKNDVTWLGKRNGLHFGRYGTVIGSGAFEMADDPQRNELSGSLEIRLQPKSIWDGGTFLAFCTPGDPFRFSLRQSQTDLLLQAAIQNGRNRTTVVHRYVEDAFRKTGPVFITATAGTNGMAIYIDGVLARRVPQFRLPPNQLTGRMVLGDSPGQPDSWSGQLLGFAIYDRELTEPQILKHYETWTQAGRPEIQKDEGNVALYLFDEHAGTVVHDRAGSGVDLSIPDKYMVLDQIFLQPFWTEFEMSRSYWSSALKNIVGFIPFGFFFGARLSLAGRVKRVALTSVLLGALLSLTIEILQSHLPTRDSGTTDIITNTFGTWVGVVLFRSKAAQASFALLRDWNDARGGARRD
ncbi:MAG TPA: VanZ family protein [Bryobacteraceae bacterium]